MVVPRPGPVLGREGGPLHWPLIRGWATAIRVDADNASVYVLAGVLSYLCIVMNV